MKYLSQTIIAQGEFSLRDERNENRYALSILPQGEVTLQTCRVQFSYEFHGDDALFLNGYQSWTYSPERGVSDFDGSLRFCPKGLNQKWGFSQYGDGHFCPPVYRAGLLRGYTYAYVRRGEQYALFASLAEKTGFTRIIFDTRKNAVTFEKDCEGRRVDGEYRLFDLLFLEGSENDVFDQWFQALGVRPLPAARALGYTSWYNCYQNISEARILSDLQGVSTLPIQPDIFQIDDGYEPFVGDWLTENPQKFPNGLSSIAQRIVQAGLRAGIWMAPFVCEKDSALFREHPEWLLRDGQGNPVFCGGNWSGAYALDFYNDCFRAYLEKAVARFRGMGFTLFKLDFLYGACMLPRPDKTRGEIMEEAMAFLRRICGDAQIIGCGVPLSPAFGKVEYCRIGPDISLDYDDKPYMRLFHAERPSTKHTTRNTIFRRQLSGRAFLNDPDVFILRDENTTLTPAVREALGTVNGLFGGLLFASDKFQRYDDAKRKAFVRFARMREAADVHVERQGRRVRVRYTLDGTPQTVELP